MSCGACFRAASALTLTALAFAGCGRGEEREQAVTAPPPAPAPAPPPVRIPNDASPARVDVGGYSLAIRCSGRGRPVAVLEAGFGLASGHWRRTQAIVARTNRVCSYDRAGIGRSDEQPPDVDRSIPENLHALLGAVGIRPPYVLAGHSAGGGYAVEFAQAYPDEVAGIVLVDSVGTGEMPREDLPLVVLEAGAGPTTAWSETQTASAGRSSESVHVLAPRSGHHIQAAQPELVAAAIRAAARGTPVPPCAAFVRFGGACP